ncbi:MT-A70 family methyltransferase [Streptomyces sp. B93]|uniref:MT-A70 family methyltransferase n=1 Tax=Streptomyces sp. B93 TaxID=2824875 RepID=UPI001B3874ED|nr:MT-A70 family methyltransferase [Streptomyces sp. B93]MBQ1089640.1 methyltransferase [Streptomyces sp. B93]
MQKVHRGIEERRERKNVTNHQTIEEGRSPDVPRRFRTILADPPWETHQQGAKGAGRHYRLMSLECIKEMPVGDLAEADSFLFLWTTNTVLRDAYDVAEAWGYVPRVPITWVKFRLGLGHYARNSTEHLLLCTRGKPSIRFRSQPTWINAPVQEHSRKPDEQYAVIERISEGPFCELFARRRPPSNRDWFVWGNEIDSDIVIPGYPVPSDRRHNHQEK